MVADENLVYELDGRCRIEFGGVSQRLVGGIIGSERGVYADDQFPAAVAGKNRYWYRAEPGDVNRSVATELDTLGTVSVEVSKKSIGGSLKPSLRQGRLISCEQVPEKACANIPVE